MIVNKQFSILVSSNIEGKSKCSKSRTDKRRGEGTATLANFTTQEQGMKIMNV